MIVAGIDVGRFSDRTVLALLDERNVLLDLIQPPLGPLPMQARALKPHLSWVSKVFIDATGLGIGLGDIFTEMGLPITLVYIVSGHKIYLNDLDADNRVSIGQAGLINMLKLSLPYVSLTCSYRNELRQEMAQMTGRFTKRGGVRYGAATGHDDRVFAVALARLALGLSTLGQKVSAHGS